MVNKWLKELAYVVGHKSLSTKRLVVESFSDIETSNFKALLTYHFLILVRRLGLASQVAEVIKSPNNNTSAHTANLQPAVQVCTWLKTLNRHNLINLFQKHSLYRRYQNVWTKKTNNLQDPLNNAGQPLYHNLLHSFVMHVGGINMQNIQVQIPCATRLHPIISYICKVKSKPDCCFKKFILDVHLISS